MRISDWSSDVCSSDLCRGTEGRDGLKRRGGGKSGTGGRTRTDNLTPQRRLLSPLRLPIPPLTHLDWRSEGPRIDCARPIRGWARACQPSFVDSTSDV